MSSALFYLVATSIVCYGTPPTASPEQHDAQSSEQESSVRGGFEQNATRVSQRLESDGRTAVLPEPEEIWKPTVILSKAHEATCRVKEGDLFPSINLPDPAGKTRSLTDHYGQRLTVVVFWTTRHRFADEQFSYLVPEVVSRYAGHGVNLVAINVGDPEAEVRQRIKDTGAKFPNLLDGSRIAFAQVATMKLPRTYLLDAGGKILWLDLEYSRGTRRELQNAILYYLQ